MKNTLENEMFDAAVSWCCSNGINVLEPEQLASLVNSLYITVRDADPTPANLVLVPLRPTRAMQDIFQQDDWQWADVLAAAESVTEEQYLFALEDDKQAQPERAPLSCTWTQEDDFDTPGVYHTSCGEMWSFTEGGIKGNNTKFCPHCGGGIKQGGQHD